MSRENPGLATTSVPGHPGLRPEAFEDRCADVGGRVDRSDAGLHFERRPGREAAEHRPEAPAREYERVKPEERLRSLRG